MTDMKCPFCGKKLFYDEQDGIYRCMKFGCVMDYEGGTEQLWQELIRTRKALDVARHTIGWINQMIDEHTDKQAIKIKCEYALDRIKQITETKE